MLTLSNNLQIFWTIYSQSSKKNFFVLEPIQENVTEMSGKLAENMFWCKFASSKAHIEKCRRAKIQMQKKWAHRKSNVRVTRNAKSPSTTVNVKTKETPASSAIKPVVALSDAGSAAKLPKAKPQHIGRPPYVRPRPREQSTKPIVPFSYGRPSVQKNRTPDTTRTVYSGNKPWYLQKTVDHDMTTCSVGSKDRFLH